ncbi:YbjN domain-containing protein [Roseivirga misakiensis]|uniref:Molecular chaperone Tir n=1 Tax=Roseivirga misakiensis TaxID=1563681 RepID=A0A1E5T5I1_9BACT|nr:YbjN domain-containing protein [Roseivirga misakiensis]OEK06620.1 molecular chaperone Tir [Roseivirga misakiensis]
MNNHFQKVKNYILDLDFSILMEDESDGLMVIESEEDGIKNLVLGVEEPLLIIEQSLVNLGDTSAATYLNLLQKNRDMVHGAFVVDETGKRVIFRDTLQLENLDLNELEASFNSLALVLSEHSDELLKVAEK